MNDSPILRSLARGGPVFGETDDEACERIFEGQTWPCKRCGVEIHWLGICDDCDAADKRHRAAYENKPIRERLKESGVPDQLLDVKWDTKPPIVSGATIVRQLRSYAGSPSTVNFHGPAGSGKTSAAVCMMGDGLARGKRARFVYVPQWIDEMRWLEREGGCHHEVDRVANFRGLVVLDELAAERNTDLGRDILLRVIERRSATGLPTITTANLPLHAERGGRCIASVLDERIASRLSRGWAVSWCGRDARREAGVEVG